VLQIIIEGSEVLDLARTNGIVGNRLEDDKGIVLAHVVIGVSLLVGEIITL
jgi:hypothetical protein